MAKSLLDDGARRRIVERIEGLGPHSRRRWGTMSLPKAVCHMADQLAAALGELEVKPMRGIARWPGVSWLVVHVLPVPRGVPTAPELLGTDLGELEEARAHLKGVLERFAANGEGGEWREHPAFGRLSGREWGKLGWKHMDHHLRQFGA